MKKNLLLILVFVICVVNFSEVYSLEKQQPQKLTLEQCISIAKEHNPQLLSQKAIYESKIKTLNQAQSNYYPSLDLNMNYTGNNAIDKHNDPISLMGSYNSFKNTLILSQNIYDFGRREDNVKLKEFDIAIARNNYNDTEKQVIYNVKNAYYNVLKSQRIIAQDKVMIERSLSHVNQTTALFNAGKKPKYDVTKALVELSKSQVTLISDKKDFIKNLGNLVTALGADISTDTELVDNFDLIEFQMSLESAKEVAYKNRSDYLAKINKVDQTRMAIFSSEKDYYPKIIGALGYNYSGSRFPLEQGWNIGAGLSWNLFNGFNTQSKIDENKKLLDASYQDLQLLKLQIAVDMNTNYFSLSLNKEIIKASEVQVKYATENLEQAELRYSSGMGTVLDVIDTSSDFNDANIKYINALYDYKISLANLEKTMGK